MEVAGARWCGICLALGRDTEGLSTGRCCGLGVSTGTCVSTAVDRLPARHKACAGLKTLFVPDAICRLGNPVGYGFPRKTLGIHPFGIQFLQQW